MCYGGDDTQVVVVLQVELPRHDHFFGALDSAEYLAFDNIFRFAETVFRQGALSPNFQVRARNSVRT